MDFVEAVEDPGPSGVDQGQLSVEQAGPLSPGLRPVHSQRFPSYWRTVIDALSLDAAGDAVVRDEQDHSRLWRLWGSALPPTGDAPGMEKTIAAFDAMPLSCLLGAIHAFELQQPEVAATKKDGLLRHYGFRPDQLHTSTNTSTKRSTSPTASRLAERFVDPKEFSEGVRSGAALVYESLDEFVR